MRTQTCAPALYSPGADVGRQTEIHTLHLVGTMVYVFHVEIQIPVRQFIGFAFFVHVKTLF